MGRSWKSACRGKAGPESPIGEIGESPPPNLTANGIQIEYEIAGRAGDPVILLVMAL
jgi:hypothetical protein